MNEENNNVPKNKNEDGIEEISETSSEIKTVASESESKIQDPTPNGQVKKEEASTPPPIPEKEKMDQAFNEYTFNENKQNEKKTKKKSNIGLIVSVIVIALVVGLTGGYVGSMLYANTTIKKDPINNIINTSDSSSVAGAVSKVASPSVVEIQTETLKTGGYFGQYTTQGAGSGVIYSEDGYIITNNHVIEGASQIQVFVKTKENPTGEKYDAELIGTNPKNDLAVIKIKAKDLTPAKVGKSGELQLGDFVLAIGNPLGSLGGTVTDGIISALDREIEIEGSTMRLLQTNAAVNPGNSGGGLFNSKGELVGIVSAKSSGNDVEGLGFAIPADIAIPIIDEIISTGGSSSGSKDSQKIQLGVAVKQTEAGILVTSVKDGGPASKAGMRAGDIIVGTKDARLKTLDQLASELSNYKAGDSVDFKVVRDGDTKTITVQF